MNNFFVSPHEAQILSINNDFSDFITCSSPQTRDKVILLIDTEAQISVIKRSTLLNHIGYDENEIISMKGITHERQQSLGSIQLILIFEHLSITHKFHVVPDNFPIPTHAILGKDFSKRHHCIIDYSDMTYTVQPKGLAPAKIQIKNEVLSGLSVVPARSETFKLFRINSTEFPCIIQKQEIAENIVIPTTIAHKPESWVRVLNISDEMICPII